jgi:3-oxoacyl-[acyl-carrier protein] reductase
MAGVKDRVAVVTGGAQGIGAAVAARLAEGGATVAVIDLNADSAAATAASIAETGAQALGLSADVSQRDQVEAAIGEVVARFGALHILVNNAGVLRDNLLFKMSDDDWLQVIQTNLNAVFFCTSAAIPIMSTPNAT